MIDNLDTVEAQKLIERNVCSDCWGQLEETNYDSRTHTVSVHCARPGCSDNGIVSKRYVERRQSEQLAERAEARRVLAGAVSWIQVPTQSADELMKSLGF